MRDWRFVDMLSRSPPRGKRRSPGAPHQSLDPSVGGTHKQRERERKGERAHAGGGGGGSL